MNWTLLPPSVCHEGVYLTVKLMCNGSMGGGCAILYVQCVCSNVSVRSCVTVTECPKVVQTDLLFLLRLSSYKKSWM